MVSVDDSEIMSQIQDLVDEEHRLRQRVLDGAISSDEERAKLAALEQSLDRCWDLLRQRRALRESGGDPDAATPRPTGEVEGYLQ
jgi:hypothetical protein